LIFGADVAVPSDRRGQLIGRRGSVIKGLTQSTGANIHVPKKQQQQQQQRNGDNNEVDAPAVAEPQQDDDDRPVYVKAASLASLLHALWRISEIVSKENEKIPCRVRLPHVPVQTISASLEKDAEPFLCLENGMAAYGIEVSGWIDGNGDDKEHAVDTLVDNERFAHAEWTAEYNVVVDDAGDETALLVFVYGAESQHPKELYQSLKESMEKLQQQSSTND